MARRLLLFLLLFFVVDIYFYQAIITLTDDIYIRVAYWLIDLLLIAGMIVLFVAGRRLQHSQRWLTGLFTVLLSLAIPKLLTAPVLLLEDLTRLFRGFPPRNIYVSELVLFLAIAVLLTVIFGLTRGRHFYKVRKLTLHFADLPAAFDGFTITQISDIHVGSFTNQKEVQKGINLANAQQSDLLLFTGDLVNHAASEMDRWISAFAQLQAPYGKYSVLGNHDYGDYIQWESQTAKIANLERLKMVHKEMGFRLLLNESDQIEKEGESIALVGVENWGKNGFQQYGDLRKATASLPTNIFKVLMSHDPSHWDLVSEDQEQHIHLTLAGHTHGMQFGIELFGFKWSPIQYFYKRWAGLYQSGSKYLYVNRGFGYHGLKGRIGMWPEITVLTLKQRR
ncbi:metallophosphoesterase [Sphingobacterium corticibacter]|uniref:Phosphohydrolase n=1 Tax=Sphingobacterium corticibacter TaxID=2171749 RepID=A0A2T8HLT1_9SPHI|nr:metallophosphoesterase [Sphingobacterium corticibacter]PVH26399.1 phosphohydrolase [Sphingobacterium corticibacter]